MLNFIIGRENIDLGPVHMDSPLYFRKAKPEWLNDGFARRAINAIDKAKVLNGFALENRYGYGMSRYKNVIINKEPATVYLLCF